MINSNHFNSSNNRVILSCNKFESKFLVDTNLHNLPDSGTAPSRSAWNRYRCKRHGFGKGSEEAMDAASPGLRHTTLHFVRQRYFLDRHNGIHPG